MSTSSATSTCRIDRIASACGIALLAAALAGCSSFGIGQSEQKAVDPNLLPANYKADLLTYLRTNPYSLVGAREASLSPPALKQFGTDSRYVSCLRAVAPDWRKEKMITFFAGEINQFVDATGDTCAGAAYQPFPELTAMMSQFGTKR